jgi:hypothetical protein
MPVVRSCGHDRHVGTCPACQRAQLARWRAQVIEVQRLSTQLMYQGGTVRALTSSGTMPLSPHRS